MENHQITIFEYQDYKEALMKELNNMANGFIKTGYYLKKIRDSEAFRNDGYENINDFAEKELGITRTVASRFMSINDKFSTDGYSLELKEEYKGLGSSRLSEMLTLQIEDHSMITPVTKIEDIRALKRFEKQEPEAVETKYEELFKDFFNGKEKELNAVFLLELKEAVEIINPMNNRTHKYKMLFMAMKEYEKGIDIKDLLKPVPEHITWESFIEQCRSVFTYDTMASGTPYEQNYPQTRINSDSGATLDKSSLTENNTEKEQKTDENVTKAEPNEEETASETVTEPEEEENEVEKDVCDIAQTIESINTEADSEPEILEGEVEEKTEEKVKTFEGCNGIPKLKTHEKYYDDIKSRKKSFSIRLNDRGYKVGDKYCLMFINDDGEITQPSINIRITYVLNDFIGLAEGYVAFGYEVIS